MKYPLSVMRTLKVMKSVMCFDRPEEQSRYNEWKQQKKVNSIGTASIGKAFPGSVPILGSL